MATATAPIQTEVVFFPKQLPAVAKIFTQYLTIAVWFGLFAGLLDGAELLLFQRINWEQWGYIIHVSKQIAWLDPLVNVLVFSAAAIILAITELVACVDALPVLIWMLVFATVFDFLSATGRLALVAIVLTATGFAIWFDRWFRLHEAEALKFWSRTCGWLIGTGILVFAGVQGGIWTWEDYQSAKLPQALPGAPNIVLIVVDTLRADHLSAYGYGRPTTPNIDRIAEEGVLFENAISASSWTFPSHASLLSGKYPSEHGMQDLSSMRFGAPGLREYVTLGDALQSKGYRTGAFSANHYFFTSSVGLGKGFIHFEDYFDSDEDVFRRTSLGCAGQLYIAGCGSLFKRAPEVGREALTWIGKSSHPSFVFLNYYGVHEAHELPWNHNRPSWGASNEVDRYDSALTRIDAEIGKVFRELQLRQPTSNTLLVITSDHGQSLGQHHLSNHGSTLYLEQIHVPLIIWYPGHVPAGVRVSAPVSNAGISATIMNVITGNSSPFPGRGLAPLWSHDSVDPPYPISELAKNEIAFDQHDKLAGSLIPTALDGNMKSIITPQWHLIEHQTRGKQLFDWVRDPGELKNLIDTPQGAAVARDLELQMQTDKSP